MEILAIIPARGGSKGIPRKNIQSLAGKPLIAHSIEAAKLSQLVDRTIVSTDDPEIEEISQKYGADVIRRPADISGGAAKSEDALLHALRHLGDTESYCPDLIVFLQCTSPLTIAEDIDGTVNALIDENSDSALSVAPFHYFLWKKDNSGNTVGINHDKGRRLMRQEQLPQYIEAGAVYVMKAPEFLNVGHRFFGKTAMYVMPKERCWEIDEPIDLRIAEMLMRQKDTSLAVKRLPDKIDGIVFDFDGVFTDNRVFIDEKGNEGVNCSRSDGWGMAEMRRAGIPMVVISTEKNPVVAARCKKLNIEYVHGVDDKLRELNRWATAQQAVLKNLIYLGNDVNDLDCLKNVGCPVVVKDAHPDAQTHASIILKANGGNGAIRELADLIMQK
ncbi:MAG: acylneuraminate cytidylyltransferase [Desulfobacterales bacterium]|nr:acylneuraminate cytidylyltransferase [Desulfobacterales bacterium]